MTCQSQGCDRPKLRGRGERFCADCKAIGWYRRYRQSPKGQANKIVARARDRERAQARRALLDDIKLTSGCIDCGYRQHPAALEFDHRDRSEKSFTIARFYHSVPWATVLAEIAKCDVRCANCHRVRSATHGHLGWWARKNAS